MCTTQPVFQVTVNDQTTHLCGKCMDENSRNATVTVQNENPAVGESCQCTICE